MHVTIVIPAYNAEATLDEALQSLLAQTYGTWTAIVVDDGSQDGTFRIAEGFARADPRVHIIRQMNAGESAARNAGLAEATGDWLVFLDADDWLLPTYLEKMIGAISVAPNSQVVHCGWLRVGCDGQHSPAQFAPPVLDLFPELSRRNCFAIHACMVRQSLVESIGSFDVTLRTCPDWDLWQRVARTAPHFVAVSEALACYRLRPSSAATDARQLLADGVTVITRGHASDPRVRLADPRYADGMPVAQAAAAKLQFVCWTAGLAIGQGQPAEPLLDFVAGERAVVSTEIVAEFLFATVPMPTGQLIDAWGSLWPLNEARVDAFLTALEAHTHSPGLSAQSKSLLMQKILTWALPAFLTRQSSSAGSGDSMALSWERIAAERADQIVKQQAWIHELEAAKVWHDDQQQAWQRRAETAEQLSAERHAWIGELEAAKAWHDDQRQIWQRRAEAAEQKPLTTGRPPLVALARALSALRRTPVAEEDRPTPAAERVPPVPPGSPGPFADPRLLRPVSREWGFDRGLPVDRYYIERFLARHEHDIKGRVLEIGDNSYTRRFGADRVTTSDVLHVTPGNQHATFVGDLTQADHIPTDTFDCIILTQTLQLIYDLPAALRTVHRVLKPGGVLLATFPGLTRTSQTEWKDSWFWRLTPASARRLFESAFLRADLQLTGHGNVLAACAFLYGLATEDLIAAELDYEDPDYDVIVTVRAAKASTAVKSIDSGEKTQVRHGIGASHVAARGLVLLYHRVENCTLDPWQLSVSPERFDQQMSVLKREATVVSLDQLSQAVTASTTNRPLVAVTFDDGYADNLHSALPILERHLLPASVFVCTGPVSHQAEFWWDTLERVLLWPGHLPSSLELVIRGETCRWDLRDFADYSVSASQGHAGWRAWESAPTPRHALFVDLWQRLQQLGGDERGRVLTDLLVWAGPAANTQPWHRALGPVELRTLAESQLIEIGAHTISHPVLAALPSTEQQAEIAGSRMWLQALLKRKVASFSYPFGRIVDYTQETVASVGSAGFDRACSNVGGIVRSGIDPFQLPRMQVKDWSGDEFAEQIRQWLATDASSAL